MAASNLPLLKQVVINGVDVSSYVPSYVALEIFDKVVKTSTIGLKKTVETVLDFNDDTLVGSAITISRGVVSATETILFRGFVRNISFKGPIVTVTCEDKLSQAKYTIVNTSFHSDVDSEAGEISEIFSTLITDNTNLTVDSSSIQASGLVNIRKKFICKQRVLMDALTELAYSLDWQFYYDPVTDKVYFEPKGFNSSTTTLTVGGNVVKLPKWDIDSSQLFNRIVVKGTQQEIQTSEGPVILDGVSQTDWTTTSVTLDNKPTSVEVFSDLNNPPTTEKIGGIDGTNETYDYEVDPETSRIIWNTDDFTPTTSYYALINYSYNLPVQVIRKNAASITLYTDGVPKSVSQFRDDIKTVNDAEQWAEKQLSIYSKPFYATKLSVRGVSGLNPGTLFTVVDNIQGVDRELMIKSVKYTFPYRYDEIFVSDKEYRTANWGTDIPQRIKRLEEKKAETDGLVTSYIDLVKTFKPRRRYHKVQKQSIAGDTLIWGHTNYGIWNSYKWGNTAQTSFILGHTSYGILGTGQLGSQASSPVTVKLVQGNMTYDEYCYDTDFHDAVNSTATFSTVTNDIQFTDGQIWYSDVIDLGTTLSHITVTLGTVTGTLVIEISSDNKASWQTVTEGTRTAVSSSDGLGTYIRLTSTGVSAVDLTQDSYGQRTDPVIKILMEEA